MQRLFVALDRAAQVWLRSAALAPEAGAVGGIVGSLTGGVLYMEDYPPKEAFLHKMPIGMFVGAFTGSLTAMAVATAWPIMLITSGAYFVSRITREDGKGIQGGRQGGS